MFSLYFLENQEGMRQSNVVEWYLNLIADQLESEDDLMEKKELVEKVIHRLIYHVCDSFKYFNIVIFLFVLGSNYNTSYQSWFKRA